MAKGTLGAALPTCRQFSQLLQSAANGDTDGARSLAESQLVSEVLAEGGKLLAEFAGVGNTDGVRLLLDVGVDVAAVFAEGDGYWDVAKNSTALHVAAWRARHDTVRFLIERGAPIDLPDGEGRTPLALAVRACVDSYWTERRSPESVQALLSAGASVRGVPCPTGYNEVDELLSKMRQGWNEPTSWGREIRWRVLLPKMLPNSSAVAVFKGQRICKKRREKWLFRSYAESEWI